MNSVDLKLSSVCDIEVRLPEFIQKIPVDMADGELANQAAATSRQLMKDDRPKHSSGDLHSRLKTRKLLGVGETDDGDFHRSKLSQILGHSDQLYIKLPYGLRIWQVLMAIMFTMTGLWALVLPSQIFQTTHETTDDHITSLPIRLYGGAVISLSVVYWMTLNSQDRDIIRMCLLSSIVYFGIQFTVTSGYWLFSLQQVPRNALILIPIHGILLLIGCFFHWAVTQRRFCTIRRCTSNRDLRRDK